jgi:membrane-associated phospholipid phosphatase
VAATWFKLPSAFGHGVRHRVRQGARGSRRKLADVNERDCRITTAIGHFPYSQADPALNTLTRSANHGKLWFAVATVLAAGSRHSRRGAVRGVLAIGGASLLANGVLKPLVPRRRPAAELLPAFRSLDDPPTSSSFPSGHSASAAAFAVSVGHLLPGIRWPLRVAAATIAFSRVYTGVHYPGDVIVGVTTGAVLGAVTSRLAARAARRFATWRTGTSAQRRARAEREGRGG